jgi:hypothetical protein
MQSNHRAAQQPIAWRTTYHTPSTALGGVTKQRLNITAQAAPSAGAALTLSAELTGARTLLVAPIYGKARL